MSCTSTHYRDHMEQVLYRRLENCGRSSRLNISPTDPVACH